MLHGLDISHYNGQLDFDSLKTWLDFIIIKATEGTDFVDPQFQRSQEESRRVGLKLGYYHFARPEYNSALAEANFFLQTVGKLEPNEVLFLDYESNWQGDVVGWCKQFLDACPTKPVIYLNQALVKGYDWTPVKKDYPLWLAQYDMRQAKTLQPDGWNYVMKQYTNKLNGQFDGDVCFVDWSQLKGDTMTQQGIQNALSELRVELGLSLTDGGLTSDINAVVAGDDTTFQNIVKNYFGATEMIKKSDCPKTECQTCPEPTVCPDMSLYTLTSEIKPCPEPTPVTPVIPVETTQVTPETIAPATKLGIIAIIEEWFKSQVK